MCHCETQFSNGQKVVNKRQEINIHSLKQEINIHSLKPVGDTYMSSQKACTLSKNKIAVGKDKINILVQSDTAAIVDVHSLNISGILSLDSIIYIKCKIS